MNTAKLINIEIKKILAVPALLAALCGPAIATGADLQAAVSVSPVGDFTAEVKGFEAKARVSGDSYTAGPFTIPWASLKTGMSLRDKHALKYVNADKYPNIEVLQALGKQGKGVAKIKFNNVEKVVRGTYKIEGQNLVASFPIKLSEFNVKDVSFKGAGVKDEVQVKMTVPVVSGAAKAAAAGGGN